MEAASYILKVLFDISQAHKDLGVTISESVKGAGAMGGSTFAGAMAGGLVGGPVGMIAGGAIGFIGGAAYAAKNGKSFKPLSQVLSEMTADEKNKLVKAAETIIRQRGIDLALNIGRDYASQFAREFLVDVFKEFSGKASGQ